VIKNTNTQCRKVPPGIYLTIYCHGNFGQYNGRLARTMHAVQSFLLLNITVKLARAVQTANGKGAANPSVGDNNCGSPTRTRRCRRFRLCYVYRAMTRPRCRPSDSRARCVRASCGRDEEIRWFVWVGEDQDGGYLLLLPPMETASSSSS
jgi:hypothetical protein